MNVRFFAGTKQQYLAIPTHNTQALYFCADTKELFWGDLLLTDGIRVVQTYTDLPAYASAADGTIYYVADTRNGYMLAPDRASWLQVIYAPGDDNGVKAISFAGLEMEEVDGVFTIDRRCARKALGFTVPEGKEDEDIVIATEDFVRAEISKAELNNDSVSLENYYTKSETDDAITSAIANIEHPTIDLHEYATKDELFSGDYNDLINQPEIPSVEGLATKEFVTEKLAEIEQSAVNLDNYYTKSEVESLIPDHSDFATKEELPSIEGLASETYIDEKIASIEIPKSPTKTSELENDTGYITSADLPTIPTKVSELENDVGYLTEHQDISGKADVEHKHTLEDISDYSAPDFSNYYNKDQVNELIPTDLVTNTQLETAINNIEHPVTDLTGYATETFVKNAIAEAELNDKEADISGLATKEELAQVESKIPSVDGLASESYVDEKLAEIKIPDVSNFITSIPEEYITESELNDKGYITEHQSLDDYAKTATVVSQKYEVLPVEGMLVLYGDNEVRLNTQRVIPVHQTVGNGGDPNMYYVTFRAFAPKGATRVIEGLSDKMDAEYSQLATDEHGRKYTTIWSAIASYNGSTWSKWGDTSTVNKYLGFYYNFHWYNEDTLIGTDKVRVILTNDSCHNDLVPDAIARRIDDKVNAIKIPDLTGYATEAFVKNAIAEAELNDKDVDLTGYVTKDELTGLASEQFVTDAIDNIDIPEIPTNISAFTNDAGYLTEHQSLEGYAKTEDIPDVSNFVTMSDVEAQGYLKEHQDLSDYAKKSDIPTDYLKEIPSNYITETELADELSKIEHPTVNLEGYATEQYVDNAIAELDIPDVSNFVTMDQVEAKGYLTEHQDISHLAAKEDIPDVSQFIKEVPAEYITETELEAKGYLTEHQSLAEYAKKSDLFSGSYNDLADQPTIPSIEGLASEQFVEDKIANIELPEINTDNLVTTETFTESLTAKANEVPFNTDQLVTNVIGAFAIGDNLKGLTIAQIFAKLLGLTDNTQNPDAPEIPDIPETIREFIIKNELPMYQISSDSNLTESAYTLINLDSTNAESKPSEAGFYQILDNEGSVIEYGYQQISVINPDVPYIVALPSILDFSTNVTMKQYSEMESKWVPFAPNLTNDINEISAVFDEIGLAVPEVPSDYTLWANLEEGNDGAIYRFIINE